MNPINLYDDQLEFVSNIRDALRNGHRSILGVASPAFGKTKVAGYIIQSLMRKSGGEAWFLVHRKNLLRQTSMSFWSDGISHGLMTSGKRMSRMPVKVGTIGTVHSRLGRLSPPKVMFVDEAHLSRGAMFESVISWCLAAGGVVIGLTGTPRRLDGKPLGDLFSVIVEAKSPSWLIETGRLSRYDMYSTNQSLDLGGLKKTKGDYNKDELADMMDKSVLVGDVIKHWKKLALNKRTVVYCVNVKHSKHTAELFNEAGIPAVHVDADTTEKELKDACEGLASGRYKVMCNCELVIEGFDLSAQIGKDITLECCILLRPTQSVARYLQMVFRALRRKPEPAIILDHAGCALKHGLPCEDREWSLEGDTKGKRKPKEDESQDVNVTQCLGCFHIFRSGPATCPSCGMPLPKKERRELEVVDGELEKIDLDQVRKDRKREQGQARSLRELLELGMSRGMKNPAAWAATVLAARAGGRKPTRDDFTRANAMLADIKSGAADNGEVF